jgi:cardiolipin synthase
MHVKAALIDDEFLLVGSQNFHYSAWGGRGSLAEFNVGTDDPAAVAEFQQYFNYYWELATPWEPGE